MKKQGDKMVYPPVSHSGTMLPGLASIRGPYLLHTTLKDAAHCGDRTEIQPAILILGFANRAYLLTMGESGGKLVY